jgi:hypothetical protein
LSYCACDRSCVMLVVSDLWLDIVRRAEVKEEEVRLSAGGPIKRVVPVD